jgi:hypothetical protein
MAGKVKKWVGEAMTVCQQRLQKTGENTSIRVHEYECKLDKQHCECESITEGLKYNNGMSSSNSGTF